MEANTGEPEGGSGPHCKLMFLEDPLEKGPRFGMLLVRTQAYTARAQVSHPPHGTPQNELIRITSGQHQAQERQPSVGNRDAAKSHNPCDSIQTQLRGVLGWPISLAWGKALELEACAGNAQEALATHPLCHHHSPTQAGWPSLPVAVVPDSELQAMPKAKPASPGSGDPHSHIDTPLPQGSMAMPSLLHQGRAKTNAVPWA